MKSIFTLRLSPDHFWEFTYLCLAVYLLFHPALMFPQSSAVVLGGGLVLLLFRGIQRGFLEKLGVFWVLFLLYSLSSTFWSASPGITLQSSGFLFLATLLALMSQQGGLSSKNRIEILLILLALIAAGLGIHQWLYGFDQMAQASSGFTGEEADIVAAAVHNKRAFGPLVTPGALAALLIFTFPQVMIRFWIASGFKKILFGLMGLILLAGLAATGGVGAWVCLAITVGFLLYKQKAGLHAGLILGLFLLAALFLVWHRGFHSWTLAAFSMRLGLWQAAWQLFLQHPLTGWGLGTFGEAYQSAGFPLGTGALFAHNLLFQLLVETGLLGTLLAGLAVWSWATRFKWPPRWEGWGVLGGVLAVFLFSFIDLPLQMAELVWVFAVVAGRLELREGVSWKWPNIPPVWVSAGLLGVLTVTGFWPPFRPWNFCLLAISLWTAFALLETQIKELQFWVALGAAYMAVQAFNSTSASGAVWFLELIGLLIAFYFMAGRLPQFQKFWLVFAGLGLVWAVKLGWYCWAFAPPFGIDWIKFQLMDVKDWVFNPNPKHLAVFLIPFIFILMKRPVSFNWLKTLLLSISLLVVFRLKALGAMAGLVAGWVWSRKREGRKIVIIGLVLIAGLAAFRFLNSSSTKYSRILEIWPAAFNVWVENPVFGVGPGVFAGEFHRVQAPRLDGVNRYLMDAVYAHSEYLDLLVAFGLVGFVFVLILVYQLFSNIKKEENKNALVGLGAAAFFDFCLRSPLTALLSVGCSVKEEEPARDLSFTGGFLALGLALGLFGAPVFSPVLKQKAEALVSTGHYPEAFRCWQAAAVLNAWDAPTAQGESDFYEQLYRLTKDETWKKKADESLVRAINLEKADGNLVFVKAKRWAERYETNPSEENFSAAGQSWTEAENALPFNAYVYFEEGLYWTKAAQLSNKPSWPQDYVRKALSGFARATQLEPNFAAAWVNLGQDELRRLGPPKAQTDLYFKKALEIYDQWQNAPGLSPEERQLTDLPPQEVAWLRTYNQNLLTTKAPRHQGRQ